MRATCEELCVECDEPAGRAGEDSLYCDMCGAGAGVAGTESRGRVPDPSVLAGGFDETVYAGPGEAEGVTG